MTPRHPLTITLQEPDAADLGRRDLEREGRGRPSIPDAMGSAVARLCAVDVGETAAVLSAADATVQAAIAAGELLALIGEPGERARWSRAAPLLDAVARVLENAHSFPSARASRPAPPTGGDVRPDLPRAGLLRQELVDTALGLNLVLQWAAHYAAHGHDADACRKAAALATGLIDCYEGDAEG